VGAAFLTSAIKALLRQFSGPVFSPEDTMRGIDSVMRQMMEDEQYLTACYARLNRRTRQLSIVSAGHPPAILLRASGEVETVEMDSEPLGVFHSVVLQRKDLRVAPGDRFFLYTDGMIESVAGGGRRAGLERLIDAVVCHRGAPLDRVAATVAADLRPSAYEAQDDLLLLAAEVRA
jgi:sigma-B regulation protein RsbU (phosphoserine phosphatase)